MSLPIFNTQDSTLSMMQVKWASQLNPLLSNTLNKAYILKNVPLAIGDNVINHLQGEALNGYIVVGMNGGYSQIYDIPSPQPKLTLILNSSAVVTISLAVF